MRITIITSGFRQYCKDDGEKFKYLSSNRVLTNAHDVV